MIILYRLPLTREITSVGGCIDGFGLPPNRPGQVIARLSLSGSAESASRSCPAPNSRAALDALGRSTARPASHRAEATEHGKQGQGANLGKRGGGRVSDGQGLQ